MNPDPEADGRSDAGVALVRAYDFVAKDKDAGKGLSFVTDVSLSLYYFFFKC